MEVIDEDDVNIQDDELLDELFNDFVINIQVPVTYLRLANRRMGAEYLSRVYVIFMLQLLLFAGYVLYPTVWWIAIQLSLITSPLVVNVWDYWGLRYFYPFKLAGLLLAEFALLEYIVFTNTIDIILAGLIIAFGLCSLLYVYTYITEKVIVLGLPPANIILLMLIIYAISSVKNPIVFEFCSSLKNMLAIYYVLYRSYIIQPLRETEYIDAGTKLHVNFLLILSSVFTILNL